LWPLSRTGFPKQFLCLTGEESLFQQAARRLCSLGSADFDLAPLIVVAGEEHRFLASEQLREAGLSMDAALLEPVGRNTAPALTLAALAAMQGDSDPVLVVTPADQTVLDANAFANAMQAAIAQAEGGQIVILGVEPDAPETGYGYVRIGSSSRAQRGDKPSGIATSATSPLNNSFEVIAFVEKPDLQVAEQYVLEGSYFWNAGMFVLKASVWLNALQAFRPDILHATKRAWQARRVDKNSAIHFVRPGEEEFAATPSESIDYAVIEKCPGSNFPISMVPLNAGWSDLGAWDSVWKVLPKDAHGNAHIGDVLISEARNTLVHASSRLVSLVGVENLIVIETPDAVLVVNRTRSQEVKHVVNALNTKGREEHALHRKVHRPWGWYDSLDEGGRFKVKRIQVKPGAAISLQKHHRRSEHWIVVKGMAEVVCGDKTLLLSENQSTYIPLGEVHRLKNPGTTPLEIIEVQSGSYLGEDDIVRFEDHYGRQ
jgi:mannose-1-phosphate guanylyltransferase/mannose-6-phosphate isomerase